jgi:hypothetical protein
MDSKQLIASLVSSLAWPAAVVCIAVLFRAQLKTLLTDRLRHIEAGPLKADFDKEGSKVETTLVKAGVPVPAHAESDELADLAKHAPEMVISEAFAVIEHELRKALAATGEPAPDGLEGMPLAQLAVDRGLISPLTLNAIEGVYVMRNLAVHGPGGETTVSQVDKYLTLVESVLYAVRQNINKFGDPNP